MDNILDFILLALVIICLIITTILLIRSFTKKEDVQVIDNKKDLEGIENRLNQGLSNTKTEVCSSMSDLLNQSANSQKNLIDALTNAIDKQLEEFRKNLNELKVETKQSLSEIRTDTKNALDEMTRKNDEKLDKINDTVSEKLDKTLSSRLTESFKMVSENLTKVSESLGEMNSIASDVGSLKKVLSNVKTRGIYGELQLSALLQQILSKDQYEENIATVPNSKERVEFAIKFPGQDGSPVYMPIDSKFPLDNFTKLEDALESCDQDKINDARKAFKNVVMNEAKDISSKYIYSPATTEFALMFLPAETIYSEIIKTGLADKIREDYKVIAVGPTTMAALLNSLQMGFKTMAIQEKTSQVWSVLNEVKTEFGKFETELKKAQKQINTASESIEKLVGTRTKALNRKLNKVGTIDYDDSDYDDEDEEE